MTENAAPAPTAYDRLVSGGTRQFTVSLDITETPGMGTGTHRIESLIEDALNAAGIVVNWVEVETE